MWKTRAKNLYIEVIGVLLFVTGITLLCTRKYIKSSEIVTDYTECTNFRIPSTTCQDALVNSPSCVCIIPLNITKRMERDVTVYYELESYDQRGSNYTKSRDPMQLKGELSLTPSEDCEPFRYNDETKQPIAPCGAIADSMFNDMYSLLWNSSYVTPLYTGLISEDDKAPYKNPPGDLTEALKNFSKPKNWKRNVWELDTMDPDNNGFQNERFIAWMKTDLKRKPAWRVNHTDEFEFGLPAAIYNLRIDYTRHPSYKGRRFVILSSIHTAVNLVNVVLGIVLLVLGLVFVIGKVIFNKIKYDKYIRCDT